MKVELSPKEYRRLSQMRVREAAKERAKAAKPKVVREPVKPDRGRVIDKAYRAWIRRQPCAVGPDGCEGPIEAAHLRFSDFAAGRVNPGLQRKSDDDKWITPLSDRQQIAQIIRETVNPDWDHPVSHPWTDKSVEAAAERLGGLLDAARAEARAEAEGRLKGLVEALEELREEASGVTPIPEWAKGIIRLALSACGERDLGDSSGAGAEGSALAQCTGATEPQHSNGWRDINER